MGGFGGGHSGGGGFHGGHSSGGGFHGGHSGGGFHSSGGFRSSYRPHRSTFIYVGGRRYDVGGGSSNNSNNGYKKPALISTIFLSVFIVILGVFLFLNVYKKGCTAIITHTESAHDYTGEYEVYDFEYSLYGNTYYGKGDDDLVYNYKTSSYEYSVKVGEKYTIYVSLINPENYEFEAENGAAFILLFVALGIAALIIGNTINNLKLYKKRLESIGDLNGDGKLDEKDLEIYLSRMNTMGDKKEELQNRVCPYCDSLVSVNDRFCQQCGAALGKMDK